MQADFVIIGSGMGGATLAAALAPSGKRILIVEAGDRFPDIPQARDPDAIFRTGFFRRKDTWLDGQGAEFSPGNYHFVGGNSKFFGAVMLRYREADFSPIRHMGGTTPGWPITYAELEPWYQAAEQLYQVRGTLGEDPTEPHHSGTYPFPPVPDEPEIADLRRRCDGSGCIPHPCRWGWISTVGWNVPNCRGTAFPIPAAARWMPNPSAWPRRCATRTSPC